MCLPVIVGFQLGLVAVLVLVGHCDVRRLLLLAGLLPHLPHLRSDTLSVILALISLAIRGNALKAAMHS